MQQTTTSTIRQNIAAFKLLTADGSISPSGLGTILEGICSAIDSLAAAAAREDELKPLDTAGRPPTLDASGLIRRTQIPTLGASKLDDTVISEARLLERWAMQMFDKVCTYQSGSFPDIENPSLLLSNSCVRLPSGACEFRLNGLRLSLDQFLTVLMDPWIPGSGGAQPLGLTNIPQILKGTDSDLSLSYLLTNQGNVRALALTRRGWEETIAPPSVKRALHGAGGLVTLTGIISLNRVESAEEAANFLVNSPSLRYFLIEHPAPCITLIDFSAQGAYIANPWTWADSSGGLHEQSTLGYLLRNLHGRTAPLTIKVDSKLTYNYIMQNPDLRTLIDNASCKITLTYDGMTVSPTA